ncbi:MAG TPA: class I SAM-dependent methyltransferase [Bacteriovoracaceae bacterium]|nr:class I SAM-dependent methyltransferase [Bacteriovoracaceae bacterium]
MRRLKLAKSGHNKLKSHHKDLKVSDLDDSIKSLPPGEWCLLTAPNNVDEAYVAHVNPMIDEKFACIQVLEAVKHSTFTEFSPEKFILEKLKTAFAKRSRFKGYAEGSRFFYGVSDGLSGLIIDQFTNASVIQINSAGIDRYRDFIKKSVEEITKGESFFLDNPKYREKESLPSFTTTPVPDLKVSENGLTYHLPADVIQKVGFYYDHRENRLQIQHLIPRLSHLPETGVDLFCYAGSWGLNALRAGVKNMDFVDQGDFGPTIQVALKTNGLGDNGKFHRLDVFKFLDQAEGLGKKFDLILCDPPAFAKSALQKLQALEGYSKLHRKVFKIAASGSVIAFSSCTHYVDHDEFQKNILEAAHKEGKKIQLLYCGMQGWDHPVQSLDDRSSYIKSYFYILE